MPAKSKPTKKEEAKQVTKKEAPKAPAKSSAKKDSKAKETKTSTKQTKEQLAKIAKRRETRKPPVLFREKKVAGGHSFLKAVRRPERVHVPVVKKPLKHGPKPWYTIYFRRPKTHRPAKNPKFARHSIASRKSDHFSVIKFPLTSEASMQKIEDNNTLVFIVDLRANKSNIKTAVRKLYDIKAVKVNTLVTPDGRKKAYVKLATEHDALEVANKIGIL
eukprot:TRINITY_DN69733_c0_g1_i1.p2 TRINITY_DN69733_c0_g1~~TRINITY_DN69733_c0_g1_i1.p2  ORF type:complete len:218 (+),score=45.13 TRINITY_DN69733_c0_g1_i1:1158-1811(+)